MNLTRRGILTGSVAMAAASTTSCTTGIGVLQLQEHFPGALNELISNIEQGKSLDALASQQLLEQITDQCRQQNGGTPPTPDQYRCIIMPSTSDEQNTSIAIVIDPWRQTITAFKEQTSGEHMNAPTISRAGIYNPKKINSDETVYRDATLFAVKKSVKDQYDSRMQVLMGEFSIQHPNEPTWQGPGDEDGSPPKTLWANMPSSHAAGSDPRKTGRNA